MRPNQSASFEIDLEKGLNVFKALALDARIAILSSLAEGHKNINELGLMHNLSQPSVTKHIQQLEQAGLVRSEYMPGAQGMQKRCFLVHESLFIKFNPEKTSGHTVEQISMPVGLFTKVDPSGTCGLASTKKIIGFLDRKQSFYDPERMTAEIIWMADGFVEYTFPNDLPSSMDVNRLELIGEICSEAPGYHQSWPSDITVWINSVEIGTWTCPGDMGDHRGLMNPEWWIDIQTQYGFLKIWSIDEHGSYIDGSSSSHVSIGQLKIQPNQPITVRIGIKEDAEHKGGFNLFGKGYGNYGQDLILRVHYAKKDF